MIRAWAVILLLASTATADPLQPAELPPTGYAGQQYVDSDGCLFLRAGRQGETVWVPRVSRQGAQVCGYPPSGQRVPVVEETGIQPLTEPSGLAETTNVAANYFVAVGSFGEPENAERAEARLVELDYGTVRGRVQGGSGTLTTIFAGPFPTPEAAEAARQALIGEGFSDAELIGP